MKHLMEDVNEFGIPGLEEARVNWKGLAQKLLAAAEMHMAIMAGEAEDEEDPLAATIEEVKAAMEPKEEPEAEGPETEEEAEEEAEEAEEEAEKVEEAKKEKWHIIDWAGNIKFGGKTFDSFEDGDDFLSEKLGHLSDEEFEEERGEFAVVPVKGVRDTNYLDPKDPRAGEKAVESEDLSEMATARSTIKKYEALKDKKMWSKQEILGVAHRMSDLDRGYKKDSMDEEFKYILHELLGMFEEGKTVDISPDQTAQGIAWLKKNVLNAKGELRDTGMVREAGFTQEHAEIIKDFDKFELVGFKHDGQSHIYTPIYRTIAKSGDHFDYSVGGGWGGANIEIH